MSRWSIYTPRFQYHAPWTLTCWYCPKAMFGMDEYGNKSVMIHLGPLGMFVLFKPFGKLSTTIWKDEG